MPSRPVSAARLERKLRAIVGALGSNILPDLESVVPLVTLESDRPEWGFAGGEHRWSVAGFLPAQGVGNVTRIALHNPLGSGLLGIVESVYAQHGGDPTNGMVAMDWIALADVANLSDAFDPTASSAVRDSRQIENAFAGRAGVRSLQSTASALAAGVHIGFWRPAHTGPWREPVIMHPNRLIEIYPAGAGTGNPDTNVALNFAVTWRVVPLENSLQG